MTTAMQVYGTLIKRIIKETTHCLFVEAFLTKNSEDYVCMYVLASEKGHIQEEHKKYVWKIKADGRF